MKMSPRELFIDMVIHRGIFKNNPITLSPCFTFMSKQGVSFYCEGIKSIMIINSNVKAFFPSVDQKRNVDFRSKLSNVGVSRLATLFHSSSTGFSFSHYIFSRQAYISSFKLTLSVDLTCVSSHEVRKSAPAGSPHCLPVFDIGFLPPNS